MKFYAELTPLEKLLFNEALVISNEISVFSKKRAMDFIENTTTSQGAILLTNAYSFVAKILTSFYCDMLTHMTQLAGTNQDSIFSLEQVHRQIVESIDSQLGYVIIKKHVDISGMH